MRGKIARAGDRRTPRPRDAGEGPDAFALIQAYEDHFSCCIEWMRLKNERLARRRQQAERRGAEAPR